MAAYRDNRRMTEDEFREDTEGMTRLYPAVKNNRLNINGHLITSGFHYQMMCWGGEKIVDGALRNVICVYQMLPVTRDDGARYYVRTVRCVIPINWGDYHLVKSPNPLPGYYTLFLVEAGNMSGGETDVGLDDGSDGSDGSSGSGDGLGALMSRLERRVEALEARLI